MTDAEFRLMERHRTWELPELAVPDLAGTQAAIAVRWDELADAREAVCREIDRRAGEWTELLSALVRIPSVNPSPEGERALADHVAGEMRALGMTVRQLEPVPTRVSNYATLAGTHSHPVLSENLLYYGHLDTVPVGLEANWTYPPFSATIAGGRMWGRGAKDCKLGIAAALGSARVLRDLGVELAGDLMITTPADEETGGHLGIARMIDEGWLDGVRACVYGEGYPERLTIGARGGFQFKVTVKGKSSHTARKEQGINAILRALRVAVVIDGLTFGDFTPHPAVPGVPTVSVNLINGGFKINVVPDRCELEADLRFPPGYTDARAEAVIRSALDALRGEADLADLDYELEPLAVMRPYAVDPAQPVAQALARCVTETTGHPPELTGMPASSDARWIYLDAKVPVVNFSHGNESGHQPNEYVDLDAILQNVKSYALLTLLLLS